MVGLCGTVGRERCTLTPLIEHLRKRDEEKRVSHTDSELSIVGSFHPLLADDQPAEATTDDTVFVVWGDVYGHIDDDGHTPRPGGMSGSARYCADLYEEHGNSLSFASGLNGGFLLLVYEQSEGTVSFVTDRVASRPCFYTRHADDTITFASNQQALAKLPSVDVQFDLEYLYEYLLLRRVYGVETPIEAVQELPPASVTTVDLDDMSMKRERYWTPTHDPVDEPFSHFVSRFTELFEEVVSEWTRDDLDYGVLLSGGSDSRLVLGALDQDPTAYHIADWMSQEAKTAEAVADAAAVDFRLLEREDTYHSRLLVETPSRSNFSGWFNQSYFTGFADEIADEVDVLVSGLYADMLFKGGPLLTPRFPLGRLGSVALPVWKRVDDVDTYVGQQTMAAKDPPSYFTPPLDIETILRNDIDDAGDGVTSHGVDYESMRDLVMYGEYYPMGADTDANFSRSLMDIAPYRTPFLDARILEFQQTVPIAYMLRRDLVSRAVSALAPELAEVPHSRTGVPLKYPFVVGYVGDYLNGFRRKHLSQSSPPRSHLSHGPWTDREELLRNRSFLLDHFQSHERLIRDLPFLEYEGVIDCYEDHLDGESNAAILYTLATLLGMPATECARESSLDASDVPGDIGSSTSMDRSSGMMIDE